MYIAIAVVVLLFAGLSWLIWEVRAMKAQQEVDQELFRLLRAQGALPLATEEDGSDTEQVEASTASPSGEEAAPGNGG